jgi:hypothetical protein
VAAPAAAQDEAALKSFFQGKRITVRLDMPGDADASTCMPTRGSALDDGKDQDKLKRHGAAIHSGDTVGVTLVERLFSTPASSAERREGGSPGYNFGLRRRRSAGQRRACRRSTHPLPHYVSISLGNKTG